MKRVGNQVYQLTEISSFTFRYANEIVYTILSLLVFPNELSYKRLHCTISIHSRRNMNDVSVFPSILRVLDICLLINGHELNDI